MAELKYGFIGTGNMGGALARAVAKAVSGDNMIVADKAAAKAEATSRALHCLAGTNKDAAAKAEFLFLGVKPQVLPALIEEIRPVLAVRNDRFILVSMAAGVTIERLFELLGARYPVIRIMPNTPVTVGEGMIEYTASDDVFLDEINTFSEAMRYAGKLDRVDEKLMDAATALAGSGPAFVYLFAESLADGAVACGLPRDKAIEYAARTIKGAAAMLLSSEKHPGELKDDVCSPGGTTIEGVYALEKGGFRGTVMDAVVAAYEKAKALK